MAEELNKRGYRTKTGKEFCKNSFNSILTQEKYIGTYSWNKRKKKNSKGHRNSHKYKPEEEQVRMKDGCPSIIDKEQFYRVQEILKERKKGTAQSKSRHFYLLGGIHKLKCAECGAYLVGTTRKSHNKEYKYYYCPNHKKHNCSTKEIRADYLDKFVANAVTNDIYKRQDLINLFNNTDEKGKIKVHKARLQGLEQSTRNILKSLRKEQSDELRAELKRISEEKQQIQAEIDKICTGQRTMTEDNKAEICKELAKKIVNGQSYEVKKYLKTTIDSITVSNDDVKIIMNIA